MARNRRKKRNRRRIKDFHEAWRFLANHPMHHDDKGFDHFSQCLDVMVVKVDPKTETCYTGETQLHRNTATRVWLEFGPWYKESELTENDKANGLGECASHDPRLDCGAPTYEEAIIRLANKTLAIYGNKELRWEANGLKVINLDIEHSAA